MVCLNDIVALTQKAIIACCFLAVLDCATLEAQQLGRSGMAGLVVRSVAMPLSLGQRRSANAASGDWYPYVIAREEDRAWIRDTPVEDRPNRPMHFWGNSRRRLR